MNLKRILLPLLALFAALSVAAQSEQLPRQWSLQACIDYALAHNVQLLKSRAGEQTAAINVTEAKAGRLPSLTGNLSQNVTYRPLQSSGGNFVNGGLATSAADKAVQSGTYGVNASWTVWNGGKTRMAVTNADYSARIAALATETSANTIQEQIAQYYVQILYMTEAAKVNRTLLEQDSLVLARGEQLVAHGKMARADLAQLQSQVSQGRYDLVNVETQIADAKVRLRQLLELPAEAAFDVAPLSVTDAQVLAAIPDRSTVYTAALSQRPEVKQSQLAIEQSQLATKMARSAYYPTVSLQGSIGDSHMTGGSTAFGTQLKNNLNAVLGVSVSIPIFDNRQTRSAVERAKVAETTARLDLQDTQKTLYQTIESYWLNARNSQAKYLSARDNTAAMQTAYDLMTEQFGVGLKNIAELLTARANLLTAEQTMLQDKYTALLNRQLLAFYGGESLGAKAAE